MSAAALPIAWKPHVLPHRPGGGFQMRALKCGASEALYGGAAGPGKSSVLVAQMARYAQHPATRGLFLRTTYTDLKDIQDRMHVLYPLLGARYVASDRRWEWPSGATIELGYGADIREISRYLGREFTAVAFDELGQMATEEPWLRLRSRVRSTDPTVPLRMRASANPGGPGHGWLKSRFVDPCGRGGERIVRDAHDPSWSIAYVPGTALDNPSLPANYWDRLNGLPPALVKAWKDGDWDAGLGLFYPEVATREMRERWWCERPAIEPWWRMWGGYDWGYRHPAVFIPMVSDEARRVYVLDAVYMHRRQDAEQAAEIQGLVRMGRDGGGRIPSGCLTSVLAGGDAFNVRQAHASQPETVASVFNQYGVNLQRANLDRAAGSRTIRRLFGEDRIRFVRTPGTERLLEELGALVPDEARPEVPLKRDADPDTGMGGDDGPDCLSGDTMVITDAGSTPIRSLVGTSGRCLTPLGWMRYHSVRPTRRNAEVVRVVTTHGSVVATHDHRVLTPTGWRKIGELGIGDEWCVAGRGERDGAAFPWAHLLADEGGLLPATDAMATPRGVRGALRADPRGDAGASQGREQGEQPPVELGSGDAEGPRPAPLDARIGGESTGKPVGAVREGGGVASLVRGAGVAFADVAPHLAQARPNGTPVRPVREAVSDALPKSLKVLSPELQGEGAPRSTGRIAHVLSVEPSPRQDTYDLTVDVAHCFAVEGGIVVHNCLRYALASMVWEADRPAEAAPPWVPDMDHPITPPAPPVGELRRANETAHQFREPGAHGQFGDLGSW